LHAALAKYSEMGFVADDSKARVSEAIQQNAIVTFRDQEEDA